jgi:hypothetical protein
MEMARRALAQQIAGMRPVFDSPTQVKDYLALHLQGRTQEVFAYFSWTASTADELEDLFFGTLTQTSVYPREVVKRALALNAGAVVLAHNHPSGLAEPSRADEYLTQTLIAALKLVDVRVLDHIVVGQGQVVSLAERGCCEAAGEPAVKLRDIKQRDIRLRALADLHLLRDALQERPAWPPNKRPANGPRAAPPNARGACLPIHVGPVTPLPPDGSAAWTCPAPNPCPASAKPTRRRRCGSPVRRSGPGNPAAHRRRPELSPRRRRPDVVARLRRGHWSIQRELDLHGLRREEARDELAAFMREAKLRGWRCLRVVHGKGLGSPGREPVLKGKVQRWLGQHGDVLAFTQASAPQGGAGALIVLLRG